MSHTSRRLAFVLILGGLSACQQAPSPERPSTSEIVARWGAEIVTVEEVDDRILALPAAQRPRAGEDLDSWVRDQIRELVVERRLRQEAEETGLGETDEFLAARKEAKRELIYQTCLTRLLPPPTPITEEEVEAAFETEKDSFDIPERRLVYHIYLRRDPRAEERRRVESLRDRILEGENFLNLAKQFSESESRHRKGQIGWVRPGSLPEGFERVIFALEEGVPSEPVETNDGFHLFYVDQIMPARVVGIEEAGPVLRQKLAAARQRAALSEIEESFSLPTDALILDREELAQVVVENDPEATVLRLGDTQVDLAQLRQHVRRASEQTRSGPASIGTAWATLEALRLRAAVFAHCESQDLVTTEEIVPRLTVWNDVNLVVVQRRKRMHEIVLGDEERLRGFYDNNPGRFSRPILWSLRRLHVPTGEEPAARMARLEEAAVQQTSLETLQMELGGEIDDLGPLSLNELRVRSPKLPPLVSPLEPGQLSAPILDGDELAIVELVSRSAPETLPFDAETTRERVAAAYVDAYTREVYDALTEQILAGHDLEIDDEAVARLREAGLPRSEISVEQLKAALDEL